MTQPLGGKVWKEIRGGRALIIKFTAGWDKGCACAWTDAFPAGCVPIITNDSITMLGDAIAIAIDQRHADTIVEALNLFYAIKREYKPTSNKGS
jgi:hypothetical protein